jgi:hypothetical protein
VCADLEAATFLPKALRSYCAVLCHHLGQRERYSPAMQRKLRASCAASLRRLPQEPVRAAVAGLDAERAASVKSLLAAA